MKWSLLILICVFTSCHKAHYIYLVRHAEKIDNSRDPELSAIGIDRAKRLATMLKNEKIDDIYSTNYKRTMHTAQPLALENKSTVKIYAVDSTMSAFGLKLKQSGRNALIVGHSNTTINMLNAIGVKPSIKIIADDDYSNFFKIKVKGNKLELRESKY